MKVDIPDPVIKVTHGIEYNDGAYRDMKVIANVEVGGIRVMTREYHTNYDLARQNALAAGADGYAWQDKTYVDANRIDSDLEEKILEEFGHKLRALIGELPPMEDA